jgi:hypothetical protein
MVGALLGIALAISYLGAAWDGMLDEDNWFNGSLFPIFLTIGALTLLGLFLFPRTIGMAFTPPVFMAPVAVILGWVRNGFGHGLTMLGIGLALWLSTVIIAKFNPQAT